MGPGLGGTQPYLHPQTCGGELLVVALVQAVLPHQGGEVLQTVGVSLTGRHVQQVVSILVPDQLQVISCQVRLQEGGGLFVSAEQQENINKNK